MRQFLVLLVQLVWVAYRRAYRRIEWIFLRRVILKRLDAVIALQESVEDAFRSCPSVSEVQTVLCSRRGYNIGDQKIYWEAPLALSVWNTDSPLFGIAVEFRGHAICIRQLQGVSGVVLPDDLRNWIRLLVSACLAYALRTGVKYVRLYRADQSLFYYFPILEDASYAALKAHQQRMRRRYDGTARQMGFVMHKRWGEWTNPSLTRSV